MALIFEQINSTGLAQLSYIVGDDKAGVAAVIDPRRDAQIYVNRARELGVSITHAVETHIHADFVSGTGELAAITGAEICGGASKDYQFDLTQMKEGDEIELGNVTLHALHTPGHTPEHISLLVLDKKQGDEPFAIFTGDTLFNLDVGRPDLLGKGTETELAKKLYHSLFKKILPLGDRVEVYPCHGAGSACGKSIGDRRQTTVGNERVFSETFKERSESEFVEWVMKDMPEPPLHYPKLKKINAKGAKIFGHLPLLKPLKPKDFQTALEDSDAVVIDARSILAFAGGHIPGSINIALRDEFPTWVGWMIDPQQKIYVVLESTRDVKVVSEHLFRIGYDNLGGYLHQGMASWENAALLLESLGIWTAPELDRHKDDDDLQILDVRSDSEWKKGHVPNAEHIYVAHLAENLEKLDRAKPVAAYCGSGYRASIAASILKGAGFERVINIPGSWNAWTNAGLPVVAGNKQSEKSA
jgi:hydroxyacylglutathione hydrolase